MTLSWLALFTLGGKNTICAEVFVAKFDAQITDLIRIFNGLFLAGLNTELVAGDDEPIYLPADAEHRHHRIVFAHGFYASALHEIAHWLVAGANADQEDYGWYCLMAATKPSNWRLSK